MSLDTTTAMPTNGRPIPDPVPNDLTLPQSVDVVVIGAGIAGVCTALELAERGLKVALCEKGDVGAEQSSRNWGWVRLSHRDPREMPLMVESVRLWKGMNERTQAETGYRQCGITFSVTTDEALKEEEDWAQILQEYQIPARVLPAPEALNAFPGLTAPIKGALYNPHDGRAEPQKASPAIANAFRMLGGTVHQNCAVRTVETSGGKVSAVVTENGTIRCSSVVVAAGIWSRLFLGNLGIDLPMLKTTGTVLRTDPVPDGPEGTFKFQDYTFRRRLDGGYSISGPQTGLYEITPDSFWLAPKFFPALKSEFTRLKFRFGKRFVQEMKLPRKWGATDRTPFEDTRIYDPQLDAKAIDKVYAQLQAAYPAFQGVGIAQRWAGYIDVMPDIIPVVSSTEGVRGHIPGLFVASGLSGHGFGLGPGIGKLMADLVTGAVPVVDPSQYRLSRFSDGSKIAPMEGILRR
ncbi:FAD-binding oxidoreductase [Salipiger sp. 1_MG-2023]|uniref:NAD(P)/FAD-dependent oxidoreductase n=1 Tax=Salipiger sp. 1_MG-2023 TaxID=3062665 RepID=UPI0026E1E44C|nr:FAD-binding oxidoreductase [Salipiger sp. 1_MG-2023]MDO6588027.1 FAD-binding oxidoreductase [Salipiger sp. 1_MG-2023]